MEWMIKEYDAIVFVMVSTALIYGALILFTRVAGLRSFSKMSSFDFATTIAMGSIIATGVSVDPPVVQSVAALAMIFVLQYIVAKLRRSTTIAELLFDNNPLLLMSSGEFIEENLSKTRVTREDIWSKLREANVHDLSEVHAVVLETTGDVSVLHTDDPDRRLDPRLLTGVRDCERFVRDSKHLPGGRSRRVAV